MQKQLINKYPILVYIYVQCKLLFYYLHLSNKIGVQMLPKMYIYVAPLNRTENARRIRNNENKQNRIIEPRIVVNN